MYHIGSFSHHALSTCTSAWTVPTYPFIYFGNIDLSTCRPVDLSTCRLVDLSTCRPRSTCRPSAIVNNKHLYMSFICTAIIKLSTCRPVDLSTCRRVDLSTCRASAIVNNKDPVRVRVSVWLDLWLG